MLSEKKALVKPELAPYGFKNELSSIHYQLSPKKLQEISVEKGLGKETDDGVLVVETGEFTGRSPKDRFIVKDKKNG